MEYICVRTCFHNNIRFEAGQIVSSGLLGENIPMQHFKLAGENKSPEKIEEAIDQHLKETRGRRRKISHEAEQKAEE